MSQVEEEEEKHVPIVMTKDNIKAGLSQIGKTFDGSSVSFIKLNLDGKELDVLSDELGNYKHLRYINFSGNHFDNIEILKTLPYILKLELSSNRLSSLDVFSSHDSFHYLQHLDLSKNLISTLTSLSLPKLTHLKLSNNQISSVSDFKGHDSLKILELRGNKLTSLEGIHNLTALEELWLAENAIKSLHGLLNLPHLKKLHLRKNNFNTFDSDKLPQLPHLSYINFRENEIVEVNQLNLFSVYHNLIKIVVADNPLKVEPPGEIKKEVLIALPRLKFIGKEEITNEEREDALNEAAERKRLAEEARKEAEKTAKEVLNEEHEKGEGEEDEG
jgi:Leucine-rich repeat (LRR) protein